MKTWFKKQMVKAKKFQPLAVLNQKLKGLDVFEPNEIQVLTGSVTNGTSATENLTPDPDEVVTRSHWQKSGSNDKCSEPICGKQLGVTNGSIHCRKCGRLFCEEHTMYQIKLSRSAQHEPVRGFWCRVCETCYKSREGYNDHNGMFRSLCRWGWAESVIKGSGEITQNTSRASVRRQWTRDTWKSYAWKNVSASLPSV